MARNFWEEGFPAVLRTPGMLKPPYQWPPPQNDVLVPDIGAAPYWYVDPRAAPKPAAAQPAFEIGDDPYGLNELDAAILLHQQELEALRSRDEAGATGFTQEALDEQALPGSPQTPQEMQDYYNLFGGF